MSIRQISGFPSGSPLLAASSTLAVRRHANGSEIERKSPRRKLRIKKMQREIQDLRHKLATHDHPHTH